MRVIVLVVIIVAVFSFIQKANSEPIKSKIVERIGTTK